MVRVHAASSVLLFALVVGSAIQPGWSQSSTSPAPTTATQVLQRSLTALDGQVTVTDATLTVTAQRIAGSDNETGSATLQALSAGASRMDFTYPSGPRIEIRNMLGTSYAGMWSGSDAISHSIATQNLAGEPIWFFPAFAISPLLSSAAYLTTYVGQETWNGESVVHVSASQDSPTSAPSPNPSWSHLTQVDFYFDSTTYLPVAIKFNVHPDSTDTIDIPVTIEFGSYQSVNGVEIPYHVQRLMNNSLVLDIQAQNAVFNSGLPQSDFNVQ